MIVRSLRLRMTLVALVSLTVALGLAGIGLVELFGRHVERRIGAELDTYLDQLSAAVVPDSGQSMTAGLRLGDPRFDQPLSGLYWQIVDEDSGAIERSRSLWDTVLDLPVDTPAAGETHAHQISGPRDARLLVHERRVTLQAADGLRTVRLAVAIDLVELERAQAEFAHDLAPSLTVLGIVLLAAATAQIAIGLKPLTALRSAVAAIRRGSATRLIGDFPAEVEPLVEEVNTLLAEREAMTERARAHAADLAHGLKTPLTALAAEVRRLRERGETGIADEVEAIASTMRRHVDRQLARAKARMGQRTRAQCDVAGVVDRVVAVVRKTPAGARLAWTVAVPASLSAAIDADDLTEILGNLLENAARHAATGVAVAAETSEQGVSLFIDDDGPGIAPGERDAALRRGGRLDTHGPGAGIGLAIAGDLAEMWGGSLRLDAAPIGGLRVMVRLPAA